VFASLVPDPDDPECPESFRKLVREVLKRGEFTPKNGDGSTVEDTPRNRCLEFIKLLVRWENSNNPEYIEPARKLIAAAHKILHPNSEGDAPKVLDPFAGGGAIPLEALRLGCEAHAIDLNPVAHLIELCTLVYPQKCGQPDSRPVPDYIKRLIAHNRLKRKKKGEGQPLFKEEQAQGPIAAADPDEIIPDVEITEAEYRKNPLAADVKYWGYWIAKTASATLTPLYPMADAPLFPIAYLWTRTVDCPNPSCGATIPLVRQLWVSKKAKRKIALRLRPNQETRECDFHPTEGNSIDFDPSVGTMSQGKASCPFCTTVADGPYLRQKAVGGKMGVQLMVVVCLDAKGKKTYCPPNDRYYPSELICSHLARFSEGACYGSLSWIPNEPVPSERPAPNSRGLSGVARYGADVFSKLFSPRQLGGLVEYVRLIREATGQLQRHWDDAYANAVATMLAFFLSKLADRNSANCIWIPQTEALGHSFSRQALQMVWDFLEINPLFPDWGWLNAVGELTDNINNLTPIKDRQQPFHSRTKPFTFSQLTHHTMSPFLTGI
jgi:putative DNA methylase